MLNKLKKIQIIKMLALKQKIRHKFMKRGDNVSKAAITIMTICFHFL